MQFGSSASCHRGRSILLRNLVLLERRLRGRFGTDRYWALETKCRRFCRAAAVIDGTSGRQQPACRPPILAGLGFAAACARTWCSRPQFPFWPFCVDCEDVDAKPCSLLRHRQLHRSIERRRLVGTPYRQWHRQCPALEGLLPHQSRILSFKANSDLISADPTSPHASGLWSLRLASGGASGNHFASVQEQGADVRGRQHRIRPGKAAGTIGLPPTDVNLSLCIPCKCSSAARAWSFLPRCDAADHHNPKCLESVQRL